MIREKKQKAGGMLEVNFYHVSQSGKRIAERSAKDKKTTAEQAKYNYNQSVKRFIRKINHNFNRADYWSSITFAPSEAPQTRVELQNCLRNYMRRVATYRANRLKAVKNELSEFTANAKQKSGVYVSKHIKELKSHIKKLSQPLKYAYVTEQVEYRTGRYAGRVNWHLHLFFTGAGDFCRADLQDLWQHGTIDVQFYNPDLYGPETAARYMAKAPEGKRRFVFSHTCTEPMPPKITDGAVTKQKLESMAKLRTDDRVYWENRYKGYRFMRTFPRVNPYNGQWYLTVIMWRSDETPPSWRFDEWEDE